MNPCRRLSSPGLVNIHLVHQSQQVRAGGDPVCVQRDVDLEPNLERIVELPVRRAREQLSPQALIRSGEQRCELDSRVPDRDPCPKPDASYRNDSRLSRGMSSEGRWPLLRGSIRRAAWMESDCMDGGMDGRVRHAYPVPVLYSVLYCSVPVNVPVARAGGVPRRDVGSESLTVIFRGALLNAGDSGVRTLGTGFTMMFTTAGHTRYTARHHSVGSGCGHLGSGRVQTPSEGEIHRLWLRYNAAEWWGFGGGGQQPQGHSRRAREPAVNADCSQQESSRASPNRIPTRIWSSPSLPDLELKASQVSAQ